MLGSRGRAGKPLRLRVQVKSFDVVARMIQAGLGIGVLPEDAARAFAGRWGCGRTPHRPVGRRRMFVCVRQSPRCPPPRGSWWTTSSRGRVR